MAKEAPASTAAVNRAKQWQIALFPFNNAATNVYFAFYTYFTYYAIMYLTGSTAAALGTAVASAALVLGVSTFNSLFAPLMRIFDGITDPICGGLMDRTRTRFGKFRPFMVVGNAMLALSLLLMMVFFRGLPDSASVWRWVVYIVSYIVYVIGYTAQCACTKAGQTCLTNDPKQRSQFVIWNMIGMIGSIVLVNVMAGGVLTNEAICPKGTITYVVDGVETVLRGAAYGPTFYDIMVPFVIIISAIYTIMAVAAIAEKDRPEFWGVSEKPATLKDYAGILRNNKEIRWLVTSAGLNKLASTVATSGTVAFLVYGCLMGDYNGLFIPFYVLCFIFMGIFFVWGSKTAGAKGQKRGVAQFTVFAFLFYIGVLALLIAYDYNNPATKLSIFSMEGGFHLTINLYTILFVIFYGCGYGAFNCCDNLTIPMVADCTDYETYRSGNYVPGIMGTVFSLVDKLISSLQTLLLQVFIVFLVPGLNALPAEGTPYMEGMKLSAIICFCLLPMASWLVTTFCMTRYSLSGDKMREVQAVNAVRKAAIQGGMSTEEAMQTWQTIDQVPAEFVQEKADKGDKPQSFLDRWYEKVFTKREKIGSAPASSNAIPIPEQYRA
ncbi:MAG: MFS transporter [Clostridia bacterium]|nr:MFS transporter [Clostridia bacterium]